MLVFKTHIEPYLTEDEPETRLRHKFYSKSKELRDNIKALYSDAYPDHMRKNRPKELPAHATYREEVYVNPYRSIPRKVSEALAYIPGAEDYSVEFPEKLEIAIKEEDTLKNYVGEKYSAQGSLSDWFFKEAPYNYLIDANAVVFTAIRPKDFTKNQFERYPRPVSMIVPCENVYMFRTDRFVVLKSTESNVFIDNGEEVAGKILYFFDHDSWTVAWQTSRRKWMVNGMSKINDALSFTPLPHYCPQIPASKLGKWKIDENQFGETLYESRLEDTIPDLKQAQQVLSDRCVQRNFHTATQEWRRGKKKCAQPGCIGGTIYKKDAAGNLKEEKKCTKCKGTGINNSGSGMEIYWVDDTEAGVLNGQVKEGKSSSSAPGGFFERDTKPLELFRIEYKDLEESLYRKLNLQYIFKSYIAAESGTAKREDREDSYRELNTAAEHLIQILRLQYAGHDAFRFGPSNRQTIQLPSILVPVRFNLENSELTREELNDARKNQYDPALIESLEEKLLGFWVGKNSTQFKRFITQKSLDPFRGYNVDQKQILVGLIYGYMKHGDKRTAALKNITFSMFFDAILTEAILKNPDFYKLDDNKKETELKLIFDQYFGDVVEKSEQLNILPQNQQRMQPPVNVEDQHQTV